MFEVGFWELVLVGVVALLVVGPERLPEVARTAGRWLGAARRMVSTFRDDIEREVRAEELKKVLARQGEFKGAFDVIEDTRQGLKSATDQLNAPLEAPATGAGGSPAPPPAGDSAQKPQGPASPDVQEGRNA